MIPTRVFLVALTVLERYTGSGMAAVVAQCSNDMINEAAVGWRVFFFRKYYLLIAFVHTTHFAADSVEQKGDRHVRTADTSVCRRRSAEFFFGSAE